MRWIVRAAYHREQGEPETRPHKMPGARPDTGCQALQAEGQRGMASKGATGAEEAAEGDATISATTDPQVQLLGDGPGKRQGQCLMHLPTPGSPRPAITVRCETFLHFM